MKRILLALLLCLTFSQCQTFGMENEVRTADNTEVVERILAWKKAQGGERLRLSFELALRYAAMASAHPELIVTDTEEVEGDYVKRKYILIVEDIEYEIWIVSKKERIITVWNTLAVVVAMIAGYVGKSGGLAFLAL